MAKVQAWGAGRAEARPLGFMISFQVLFYFSVRFVDTAETEKRAVGNPAKLEQELRETIPAPGKHTLLSGLSRQLLSMVDIPRAVVST